MEYPKVFIIPGLTAAETNEPTTGIISKNSMTVPIFIPGFIRTKDNVDYLYAFSSRDCLIGIWDLNNKNCFKKISSGFNYRKIIRGSINYCLILN